MKSFLALAIFASFAYSQPGEVGPEELADPRGTGRPREWIRAGAEVSPEAAYPLLVIHWMPSPEGAFDVYQISGVPGYYRKERVEAFLKVFYSPAAFAKKGPEVPGVIVCGNNWGAGAPLKSTLAELSQQLGFSLFHVGGRAFRSVRLLEEPADRRGAIQRAFDAANPKEKEPNRATGPTAPSGRG